MKRTKFKSIVAILSAIFMGLSFTGCQLAKEESVGAKNKDQLIGVFITTEYLDLFDMEGYLEDHIVLSGDTLVVEDKSENYNGRLYATLVEKELTNEETGEKNSIQEYEFQDVDGISFFAAEMTDMVTGDTYVSSSTGDGIIDGKLSVHSGDEEEKTVIDGKIYTIPGKNNNAFYVNPVYQSADGKVYAISGQGIMLSGSQAEGCAFSQKIEDSTTTTINGKSKTRTCVVNTSIETMLPPTKIVLLQMDKNSSILLREAYDPGKLPKSITPEKGTNYLILESYKIDSEGNEKVVRSIFMAEDQSFESFYAKDNIIDCQSTMINW